MQPEKFAEVYLQNQQHIHRVLKGKHIFDEERLHDTYIALYDHRPHPEPEDFAKSFIRFYQHGYDWELAEENPVESYDNRQLAALHIIDESDWQEREKAFRRLDRILRRYFAKRQPRERNRRRNCKILRLYLSGLSESEISYKLKISQPAVNQSLQLTIERLKLIGSI